MKNTIRRYSESKESEINKLGVIPETWSVHRVKDVVTKIGNGVTPRGGSAVYEDAGIPFLRSQNVYDDGLRLENVSFISSQIHNEMKSSQLKHDDILINITGASIGRTCLVPASLRQANINQHIAFLRIRRSLNPLCIAWFLKSCFIKNYIQIEQNGASKEAFNLSQIANIPLALPPISEQKAIAHYLDTKTAQIDRKIDLLTQKAKRYEELKRSLINETVTRGLDKSVSMKDSGIEWIGEIPEHWNIKRLKEILDIVNGSTPKSSNSENWDGDIYWVTTDDLGKLESKFILDTKRKITETGFMSCGTTLCPENSIILSSRAPIGHIGILSFQACTNQGCKTLVPYNKIINSIFLYYKIFASKERLQSLGRGTTFIELSTKELSLFNISLPPLSEQKTIADYLDTKTAQIDQIIQTINTQIEKLKELRKTLINDVVTGKIKIIDNGELKMDNY